MNPAKLDSFANSDDYDDDDDGGNSVWKHCSRPHSYASFMIRGIEVKLIGFLFKIIY